MDNNTKPTKELLDKWHADPKNWKWGIFYFNKEDQRIFTPKKIKQLGWTINFGNLKSTLVFLGMVIGCILIIEILIKKFGA